MPCRPSICTMSIGRAWAHKLPGKLDQAAKYGFEGIELFYEDLEFFTYDLCGDTSYPSQIEAAKVVRNLCQERNLEIIALQPFLHAEGLLDRSKFHKRMEELKAWFKIVHALGTNVIEVPSNFLPAEELTGDMDVIVSDLQHMADMGAAQSPPVQFAYEALAWSPHVHTWEQCWDVVQRVDRDNFGICFDTFNIAGRVYADPCSQDGMNPNADAEMAASLERMKKNVDVKKIVFVQLADGERLSEPMSTRHEFYNPQLPMRLAWSRNARLFYGEKEQGAYLPTRAIVRVLLEDLGYEGWVSHEVFHRCMGLTDPMTPENLAARGAESWRRMYKDAAFAKGLQDYQPKEGGLVMTESFL